MAKKPTRKTTRLKNPRLRLNKDSLQPVSEAALGQIAGATGSTPCPCPSTLSASPSCTFTTCCY
jgi:hypothetical protein